MSAIERPFFQALQTASWRGVPFAVRSATIKVGRRTAIHEYPYRDDVWVEDLGRAGRRIQVSGFLVEDAAYGGTGDVIAQRAAMITACETEDNADGELVHPSLGRLTVSLIEFECEEGERARSFEIRFSFVESGIQEFPTLSIATQAATGLSAIAGFAAHAQDFIAQIQSYLTPPPIIGEIERTASNFVSSAESIVSRATGLVAMVATLPGQFGRFVGQFVAIGASVVTTFEQLVSAVVPVTVTPPATTVDELMGKSAQAREAVTIAGASLSSAASSGDWSAMASATGALVAGVALSNPDPHQAVQSLLLLRDSSVPQAGLSPDATAVNAITVALFRRTAVTALAQVTAGYQPTSYEDAETLRTTVVAALETEILTAADAGDDAAYNALIALEVAVVQDLTTRGASLAAMQTVTTNESLPLLVLAQRLYQDVTRYDTLLQQAQPVNPCFAPTSFQASLT